jgi:hypothetical protein
MPALQAKTLLALDALLNYNYWIILFWSFPFVCVLRVFRDFMTWRVLRMRLKKTASSCEGQRRIYGIYGINNSFALKRSSLRISTRLSGLDVFYRKTTEAKGNGHEIQYLKCNKPV